MSSRLSPIEREALSAAVEQVNDFLLSELVELYDKTAGPAAMRMFSPLFLPDRHAALYDFALLRSAGRCASSTSPDGFRIDGNRHGAGARSWFFEQLRRLLASIGPRIAERPWGT